MYIGPLRHSDLFLAGLLSIAIAPPLQATSTTPSAQCTTQALSFASNQSDQDRAAYLCQGATSSAPAQCYWEALSFGASPAAKNNAARLCQGATSTAPAQCYWESRNLGNHRSTQRQIIQACSAKPPVIIPIEIQDCTITTQSQLRVPAAAALNACTEAFYHRPPEPRIDLNPLLR